MISASLNKSRLISQAHGRTHSISQTHLAGFLIAILLACLACTQSPPNQAAGKSNADPSAVTEQEPTESSEDTLLLRYYPPPSELPKVQLVSDGAVKSATDGIILSAEWDFDSAQVTNVEGPSLPFMWPEATSIDPTQTVLRFHTDIEPGYVFVEGYVILRPDDIGESPSVEGDFSKFEEPSATYDCSRFQTDPCMRTGPGNSVEVYGIPPEIFDVPHLLLVAKWNIDPEKTPEGIAIANWAWHIAAAE